MTIFITLLSMERIKIGGQFAVIDFESTGAVFHLLRPRPLSWKIWQRQVNRGVRFGTHSFSIIAKYMYSLISNVPAAVNLRGNHHRSMNCYLRGHWTSE